MPGIGQDNYSKLYILITVPYMQDQIFLLNGEKKLIELNESEFITEDQFQSLLANYPNLISGSQINPENPRKWILISREVGIPGEEGGW